MDFWISGFQFGFLPTVYEISFLMDPSARTSLHSTSCSRHYQWNWDAGRSPASSNHCFMVASFRERLGSKLAAHCHHGQAPAASWFQVDASERPFRHGSDSALTAEMFRGSSKRTQIHPFPVTKQQQHTATLATSICNTGNGNRLRNPPHNII